MSDDSQKKRITIGSNLAIGRQYVLQKLKKSDRTPTPQKLHDLSQEFKQLIQIYKDSHTTTKTMLKGASDVTSAETQIGKCFTEFAETCEDKTFGKFSQFLTSLDSLRSAMQAKLEKDYLDVLQKTIDETKRAKDAKAVYDKAKLEYDDVRNKLFHSKDNLHKASDYNKKIRLEEDLEKLKQTMEERYEEAETEMEYQIVRMKTDFVELGKEFMYNYFCLFETGSMLLKGLESLIGKPKERAHVERPAPKPKPKKEEAPQPIVITPETISTNKTKVFGIPLEEIMKREEETMAIPAITEQLIRYIEQNGTDIEGIFRIPGSTNDINRLRRNFDRGHEVVLEREAKDIHVVAALLKMFIKDMPNPLICCDAYDNFIAISTTSPDQQPAMLTDLIRTLPTCHQALLKRLMQLMVKISENRAANKMTPSNLSIVFSMNLAWPRDNDPARVLKDTGAIKSLFEVMLVHFDEVFASFDFKFEQPVPKRASQASSELSKSSSSDADTVSPTPAEELSTSSSASAKMMAASTQPTQPPTSASPDASPNPLERADSMPVDKGGSASQKRKPLPTVPQKPLPSKPPGAAAAAGNNSPAKPPLTSGGTPQKTVTPTPAQHTTTPGARSTPAAEKEKTATPPPSIRPTPPKGQAPAPARSSNRSAKGTYHSIDSDDDSFEALLSLSAGSEASTKTSDGRPLPPNWYAFENDQGITYYYNAETGDSSWETPEELDGDDSSVDDDDFSF